MEIRHRQKTVLVVGATSGIGKATALAFARTEANIVVTGRRETEGLALVDEMQALEIADAKYQFIKADITDSTSVSKLFDTVAENYPSLDIAINNAGIEGTPLTKTADYEESVFDAVIDTNLKGIWRCMKHEIPLLIKSKGVLINMASIAGFRGNDVMGCAYTASKHGIIGLTRTAAREYAPKGVRINCICPGVIQTDIAQRNFLGSDRLHDKIVAMHPLGRLGTADEVAESVVWLSSESAGFITGHSLVIDGGVTA